MTDKEFDKLLKNSVQLYGKDYDEIDNSEHQFSESFEKNIKILIDGRNINHNRFKRLYMIMASAAAVLVLGFAVYIGVNVINFNSTDKITSDTNNTKSTSSVSSSSSDKKTESDIKSNTYNETDAVEEPQPDITKDVIGKSIENNAAVPSAEPEYPYNISAVSKGENITLNENNLNNIASIAKKLVSDPNMQTKTAFTDEIIDNYRRNGFYISVSRNDGQPVIIDETSDIKFDKIILMMDNESGFALAVKDDQEFVYRIPDLKNIYQQLSDMI